jgi:hypothetical protein
MFSMLPNPESALEALRRDIEPGEWRLRHGSLLDRTALDLGYRLAVAYRGESVPGCWDGVGPRRSFPTS